MPYKLNGIALLPQNSRPQSGYRGPKAMPGEYDGIPRMRGDSRLDLCR